MPRRLVNTVVHEDLSPITLSVCVADPSVMVSPEVIDSSMSNTAFSVSSAEDNISSQYVYTSPTDSVHFDLLRDYGDQALEGGLISSLFDSSQDNPDWGFIDTGTTVSSIPSVIPVSSAFIFTTTGPVLPTTGSVFNSFRSARSHNTIRLRPTATISRPSSAINIPRAVTVDNLPPIFSQPSGVAPLTNMNRDVGSATITHRSQTATNLPADNLPPPTIPSSEIPVDIFSPTFHRELKQLIQDTVKECFIAQSRSSRDIGQGSRLGEVFPPANANLPGVILPSVTPAGLPVPTALHTTTCSLSSECMSGPGVFPSSAPASIQPNLPPRILAQIQRGECVNFHSLYSIIYSGGDEKSEYVFKLTDDLTTDMPSVSLVPRTSARVKIDRFLPWLRTWNEFLSAFIYFRPHLYQQLLQYQNTITRFAGTYQCAAWLAYDAAFRQHIANNPMLRWDTIHADLFDRYLRSAPVVPPSRVVPFPSTSSRGSGNLPDLVCYNCRQPGHISRNCPRMGRRVSSSGMQGFPAPQRHRHGVCFAFNDGQTCHESCQWAHRCSLCNGIHPRIACYKSGKN